jgi:putative ABC transport system permease protein
VSRLAWSQLRYRAARSAALLLGMLGAVTAFCVLTASARTSQLRTVGTVTAHFRAAYDILVRPAGSRTRLESSTGTVQPNFLSGIYGGISLRQYHEITRLPGVSVAAPIAMVGYSLPIVPVTARLPATAAAGPGRQLYRLSTTWVSEAGRMRIRQPPSYVYLTSNPIRQQQTGPAVFEQLPSGAQARTCDGFPLRITEPPFGPAKQASLWCWSRVTGMFGGGSWEGLTAQHPGFAVYWSFPMLIAAIDPAAEAKLDGLNQAVTSGRYLGEKAGPAMSSGSGSIAFTTFPVLAAARSGVGEYAVTQVARLARPAGPPRLDPAAMRRDATAAGQPVSTVRVTAAQAYQQLLAEITGTGHRHFSQGLGGYWSVGPTRYHRDGAGRLVASEATSPASVWSMQLPGAHGPPMDNAATGYRGVSEHKMTDLNVTGNVDPAPVPRAVGVFDPGRISDFDRLSGVPLGPYHPTAAAPVGTASTSALHGADLQPDLNLGGYVSQPVQLITTLAALPTLQDSSVFGGNLHASDPISVIRVRVAGVTGPNPVSLERIKEVAQQIAVRTGLDVDIVTGSSPAPTTVALAVGRYGQPALTLHEGWVKKGVAVAILAAVDKKSVLLFVLILVVCALFVANSATAAVRGRRQELGVLACLGWTQARLFAVALGELALIGLTAGILGGLASLPISAVLRLHASPGRAALAVPAAVVLAVTAGTGPAWLAARADPVASVRPPVLAVRRGRHQAGLASLALVNVLRTPGRSVVGALSLAVGVAALTLVTGVTPAFRGVVVGSLLGDAVAVQVRAVDYVAVVATVALGVVAVADVVALGIRERSAELATLRALGWPESALGRLVIGEALLIGVAGSVTGAAAGLAATAEFTGQVPLRLLLAALASVLAAAAVTTCAAILPAQLLRHLPTAQLLAEE